jgi:hypothetical protein
MTPSAEGVGIWDVVWEYKSTVVGSGGDNPLQPDETELYVGLSVDSSFTLVDMYKSGFSLASVDINNPNKTTDVGGTLEALHGNPISKALPTTTITITEDIVSDNFTLSRLEDSGKRNLNPWLGLPAGSVVFAGVTVNRTGQGKYKMSYKFVWDEWYHLRQIPDYDENGKVIYDNSVTPVTQEVFWRQPFKETIDFGFQPQV